MGIPLQESNLEKTQEKIKKTKEEIAEIDKKIASGEKDKIDLAKKTEEK
jgi:hypothetical protein